MTITNPLTVLCIDTAITGINISVQTQDSSIHTATMDTERGQAAYLIPMVQDLLSDANIAFSDLDLIGVTRGPGSFTGVRIGITTAKTLGFSLNIPVIGLNTLDIMARQSNAQGNQLILLETKRQDFYGCYYDAAYQSVGEPFALEAQEILKRAPFEKFTLSGNCLDRFKTVTGKDFSGARAIDMLDGAIMVQKTIHAYQDNSSTPIEPLYLRGADISRPKTPPRRLKQA